MLEESLPSIWASMNSWFTRAVLFIVINAVIGTIFFSSAGHKPEEDDHKKYPRLLRRTSSVLERFRSFNLYRQKTQELPPLTTTLDPQPLQAMETSGLQETVRSTVAVSGTDLTDEKRREEPDTQLEETLEASEFEEEAHYSRSRSDTHPTAGDLPKKLARKMKKSESARLDVGLFKEEMVEAVQRPATMREGKVVGEDEEVDARADDFINRFKQQLKLQRLDSLMRYNRGK